MDLLMNTNRQIEKWTNRTMDYRWMERQTVDGWMMNRNTWIDRQKNQMDR